MKFPLHVLSEYALLADGERGALVGPRGDFAWMCAPRWDSHAVFSALIGGAGMYAVTPAEQPYVWGGYYETGTLIWHSRWVTTDQEIECCEALSMPGDPHTAVVLRRVLAIDGQTRVRVVLDPRPASASTSWARSPGGTGRGPPGAVRCTCAGPASPPGRSVAAASCWLSSRSRWRPP